MRRLSPGQRTFLAGIYPDEEVPLMRRVCAALLVLGDDWPEGEQPAWGDVAELLDLDVTEVVAAFAAAQERAEAMMPGVFAVD